MTPDMGRVAIINSCILLGIKPIHTGKAFGLARDDGVGVVKYGTHLQRVAVWIDVPWGDIPSNVLHAVFHSIRPLA